MPISLKLGSPSLGGLKLGGPKLDNPKKVKIRDRIHPFTPSLLKKTV